MEDRADNLLASENLACDRLYDAELAVDADGISPPARPRAWTTTAPTSSSDHGTHGNALAQVTGPYRIRSLTTPSSAC